MKKLLVLLLVLCLAVLPAFADTSVIDFTDFTWEIDNEMVGGINEKVEGVPYVYLYPNYSDEDVFHANMNCVWLKESLDVSTLTEESIKLLSQAVINNMVTQYTDLGYDVKDAAVLQACVTDMSVWGRSVIMNQNTYAIDLAHTGEFITLYSVQIYVDDAFGTYIFTATADDFDAKMKSCIDLLDAIVWAD